MRLMNLLCHPIDNLAAFKEEVRHRNPLGKWNFVRNIASGFLTWIGVHIVVEKFKVDLRSALPGLAIIDYFVLLLYTFYLYTDNVMRALQPLCVVGIVAPVRKYIKCDCMNEFSLLIDFIFRLIRVP